MQNPKNCDKAKKIICDLNKSCGFGCQMHHVMYCFITAYSTNRTMILESKQWRYNIKGFEAYFQPLSETCNSYNGLAVNWNGWFLFYFILYLIPFSTWFGNASCHATIYKKK